jgi:hypothetical protein
MKKTHSKLTSKVKSRIPEFSSYEDEAEWLKKHNIADYQDEFKTVKARFAKNLSVGLHIRLDPDVLMKLRNEAKEKGIGPTTLARMWIMEQLSSSHL